MVFSVYVAAEGPREAHAMLDIPATPYEVEDALDKVRLQDGEKLFLEIEEYYDFAFLAPYLEDAETLHELNSLAERLSGFSDWEATAFAGLVKMDVDARSDSITVSRLVDLAGSVGHCHVVDALDDSRLGRFYVENGFVAEIEKLSDEAFKAVEDILDYEQIGRKMRLAEGGVFVERNIYGYNGYVLKHSEMELGQKKNVPVEKPDYAILLEVSKGFFNDPDYDSNCVIQLKLPASQVDLDTVLNALGAADWSEAAYTCLDCKVPALIETINQTEDISTIPNKETAAMWFRRSAETENDFSQYALGKLLLEERDKREAVRWLEKAAEAGNQHARYRVGKLYLEGAVVKKNVAKAIEYLAASAKQGNQYAQYTLGKLYLLGKDVKQDKDAAIEWLTLSARQGNPYAKFFLTRADNPYGTDAWVATLRMMHHMGNIFRENTDRGGAYINLLQIYRKRRRELQRKRKALGHHAKDHEEHAPMQPMM